MCWAPTQSKVTTPAVAQAIAPKSLQELVMTGVANGVSTFTKKTRNAGVTQPTLSGVTIPDITKAY